MTRLTKLSQTFSPMKYLGRLTIKNCKYRKHQRFITIEVHDIRYKDRYLKIRLNPSCLANALTGIPFQNCIITWDEPIKELEGQDYSDSEQEAFLDGQEPNTDSLGNCLEGWTPGGVFGGADSGIVIPKGVNPFEPVQLDQPEATQ